MLGGSGAPALALPRAPSGEQLKATNSHSLNADGKALSLCRPLPDQVCSTDVQLQEVVRLLPLQVACKPTTNRSFPPLFPAQRQSPGSAHRQAGKGRGSPCGRNPAAGAGKRPSCARGLRPVSAEQSLASPVETKLDAWDKGQMPVKGGNPSLGAAMVKPGRTTSPLTRPRGQTQSVSNLLRSYLFLSLHEVAPGTISGILALGNSKGDENFLAPPHAVPRRIGHPRNLKKLKTKR